MGNPTYSAIHYDAILSNMSLALLQDPGNYIATRVFPIVPVRRQADKYRVFDREWFLRDDMQVRAPATESAGTGYTMSTDSYFCTKYGLHHDIPYEDLANADSDLDLNRQAVTILTNQVQQRLERAFTASFLKTGVWGTDYTGKASSPSTNEFIQWSDYTNSNPITDVDLAIDGILKDTGLAPNTFVLGQKTFRALQRHPLITGQFKYVSSESITADMIGAVLGIPNVLVARAVKATNAEGQTLTTDFITGKVAWLGHVAPVAGPQTPTAGVIFNWLQAMGGDLVQAPIRRFSMDSIQADRIETEVAYDMKVVAPVLGAFFTTAVA